MGRPPFYGRGPRPLLWAGSQLALGTVTMRGIPNCLNYCEMFIVYKPGGLRVGVHILGVKVKQCRPFVN
jgi:hypothetical protein